MDKADTGVTLRLMGPAWCRRHLPGILYGPVYVIAVANAMIGMALLALILTPEAFKRW
jgi:hypothetical protein